MIAPPSWKRRRFVLRDDVLKWYKGDAVTERGHLYLQSATVANSLEAKEATGATALNLAACYGCLPIVSFLLSRGADLHAVA